MPLVPDDIVGKISFFQSKNTPWAANAVAIGTTTTAVSALATKVTTAQTKLAAQTAAFQAAKNATADLHAAVHDMATSGADIIKQIRAKAATDSSVYSLAQIPPPATPAPVAAPGTPTDFKAVLNPDGSLKLTWKCPNPANSQGTLYQLARRTGSTGPFSSVGSSGTRSFIDATVPAGVASVTYQITAVRSTAIGVTGVFIVNFGSASGSGAMTASVVSAPKLAA